MTRPTVSVVIPTRSRPQYLEVALASIAPQATRAGAEVLVVDDAGDTRAARELAARFGARYAPHAHPRGLNAARNTGVERSGGELVVFVDDDVRAAESWLEALAGAAERYPDVDVFTGPIRARLEGRGRPRSCGREQPPITSLDLGPADTPTALAWGANMAIRRGALERVGAFDVSIEHGGDEQEWQERLASANGSPSTTSGAMYVAAAEIEHRRAGADARLPALSRVAHTRGRAARRFDARRGIAPPIGAELITLARCAGHVVRRRCPAGLTMVAHSAGRVREAARERLARAPATRGDSARAGRAATDGSSSPETTAADDFLSGESGTVAGVDALRRELLDAGIDAIEIASGRRARLARAARSAPPRRRVLVLGVQRPEHASLARAARVELARSRHEVEFATRPADGAGKFENVNRLLAEYPLEGREWLLIVDDDVQLPRGFLDRFVFLCERFDLRLAQPAHRLTSHAAWRHTRRQLGSVVRVAGMVEIGPVTALHRDTVAILTPFPDTRMGWGLDAHWAALAREHGWRCGVVDSVAIRHRAGAVAAGYSREGAIEEARELLSRRPYLAAAHARATLERHRRW